MCGISGLLALKNNPVAQAHHRIHVMNQLLAHRGPDDAGVWVGPDQSVAFGHRRLSIIDLTASAHQPMVSPHGTILVFNGEIYNYLELREALKDFWTFQTHSDTEVILAAYAKYGPDCVQHFRGMFAFALWDERQKTLFCARDRFGIKPFYYTLVEGVFYFASEAKALLPFVPTIETNPQALGEYIVFQYTLGEQTLFKYIKTLQPAHTLRIAQGELHISQYWELDYAPKEPQDETSVLQQLEALLHDSIRLHLRSDVPVASYLSGGIDSSLITLLAYQQQGHLSGMFHGRFLDQPAYDESPYAQDVADALHTSLSFQDITSKDFQNHFADIIYALDFPVAGPGSFPQFMVSQRAAQSVKVILGGQGGDEIFGGYARYVIAYFEQCLKGAINGDTSLASFPVSAASMLPHLDILKDYQPLLKEFWGENIFGPLDERYFKLIDKSGDFSEEIDQKFFHKKDILARFKKAFNEPVLPQNAFFDSMMRFDFCHLLPALLHVEDRVGMAHSLESRVPFLDHPLVEFTTKIPHAIKFPGGMMKSLLKKGFKMAFPPSILNRRDKMGFPVPLNEWVSGDLKDFVGDIFSTCKRRDRPYLQINEAFLAHPGKKFCRKIWGLMSLEMWHQQFHDRAGNFKAMLEVSDNFLPKKGML